MPTKTKDIKGINIASGLRTRSRDQQKAIDHPGHMHEYVFGETLADFHWEIMELYLQARADPITHSPLVILAPRNHGKTTLCGETIPLWEIGNNPGEVLGQIISSKDTVAKKRVKRVADCVQNSPRFRELFGDLYPGTDDRYTWSPSGEAIEVKCDRISNWNAEGGIKRDPTLAAYGVETSVEGARATLQVFDDVVNNDNARSEAKRRHIWEKYHMTFTPMLNPGGVAIILGTRYHYLDLYAELIATHDREELYTGLYSGDVDMMNRDRAAVFGEDDDS